MADIQRYDRSRSITPIVATVGAFALTGVGLAIIAWSRNHVVHDMPQTAALEGEVFSLRSRAGTVAYYVHGVARRNAPLGAAKPPLLFIHSVNAAASSHEMKPLYDHYARERRVYALDLPGFGFSERTDRAYTPELMRLAINDFVERELKGGPVDAVALSLGSEFLALAAQAEPKQFRSLSFLSPTGMSRGDAARRRNDSLHRLLRVPLWRRPVYDLLTSRPSLRYFTSQSMRRGAMGGYVNYAYVTSHQPAAEHAPFAFVSGRLFTPTIFNVYDALAQPCALVYGRDAFTSYDRVDVLRGKPNWRIAAFEDAGALVHWDNAKGVVAVMDKVLA